MKTAEGIKAAQEILGKVEGMKSNIRSCKTAKTLEHYECTELLKPLHVLDIVIREILKNKEKLHEQGGGVFSLPVAPKMEISKNYRANVYKR